MSSDDRGAHPLKLVASDTDVGVRLDAFLARQLTEYSRSKLRRAIDAGGVTVDGAQAKPSMHLRSGQQIEILLPEPKATGPEPEAIPLTILFEDETLAVIDKPPGMVVHPSKGHGTGTLAAALRYHFDNLSSVGGPARPGIVHRLDRDTSGVIVVAKTDVAHAKLAAQFADRTTEKEYHAIVCGLPDRDRDIVEHAIGPHPREREKMAVRNDHPDSRPAETFFEVTERFDRYALLCVRPKTGRTHQIRVHLCSVGLPVLCDRLYGGRASITRGELLGVVAADGHASGNDEVVLNRQALHAYRLQIAHPTTGERLEFVAPFPQDMTAVIETLRRRQLR